MNVLFQFCLSIGFGQQISRVRDILTRPTLRWTAWLDATKTLVRFPRRVGLGNDYLSSSRFDSLVESDQKT